MIPQTREMLVPGARIRTLRDRLESADEREGAVLVVSDSLLGETEYVRTRATNPNFGTWRFRIEPNAMLRQGIGYGYEIVSSPAYAELPPMPAQPHAPLAPTPVVKPFDAELWVRQLMSQTGKHYLPPEILKDLLQLGSKSEINKAYFEYVEAHPDVKQEIPEASKIVLDKLVSVQTSPEYRNVRRSLDDYRSRATRSFRDANASLEQAMVYKAKLDELENNSTIILSQKIKAIIDAGWYTLDLEHLAGQELMSPERMSVVFKTPPVMIKHFNSRAGLQMDVPMGTYRVEWYPRQAIINVAPDTDNVIVEGYCHPHVASDGSVCWGNASEAHTKGMTGYDVGVSLEALQVILTTYNAASPYISLDAFQTKRERMKRTALDVANAGRATEYVQTDDCWIEAEYMPEDWASTYQIDEDAGDDDEPHKYLMQCYSKIYSDDLTPVSEGVYYIKYRNGRYYQVPQILEVT